MEAIARPPHIFSEKKDKSDNQIRLLQRLKYKTGEDDAAKELEGVCLNYQKSFPGFIQYLKVYHEYTKKKILNLWSENLDVKIPLNTVLNIKDACIPISLIDKILMKLVFIFIDNLPSKNFKVYFFNSDCVQFTQVSEMDNDDFLVKISCFPQPDINNNYLIKPFDFCKYTTPLNEEEIVKSFQQVILQFSKLTNMTSREHKISYNSLENNIIDSSKVKKFQDNLRTVAGLQLKTFFQLQFELWDQEETSFKEIKGIIDGYLSLQIKETLKKISTQSNSADDFLKENGDISFFASMKVKGFIAQLEDYFEELIEKGGPEGNSSINSNKSTIFVTPYKPTQNVKDNILQVKEQEFDCELFHMVILNSFLESKNQEKSQLTYSSINIQGDLRDEQSYYRNNLSIYYEYGQMKDRIYWVYIGIILHFMKQIDMSPDLKTSLVIVLKCLKDAYEKPHDKEYDFELQYLTKTFRGHLSNIGKNLIDTYLEKTWKYFQLSQGITTNEDQKMIEFNRKEFKIKLPQNLFESLERNENGEILFTVPIQEESPFSLDLSSIQAEQRSDTINLI